MRYEINSQNTKRAISLALRHLVDGRHSDYKVTVRDIIDECGVSRNTFYYHFEDLGDLFRWTMKHEIFEEVQKIDALNGKDIRNFLTRYFTENRKFLNYALAYIGLDKLRDVYFQEIMDITLDYVKAIKEKNGYVTDSSFETFISSLCAEAVCHILIMSFKMPEEYNESKVIKYFRFLFDYMIPDMLNHSKNIDLT